MRFLFFNWRVSGITPLDLRHQTTTEVTDVRPRPLATGTTLPTETHRPPLGQTGGEGAPTGGGGHPPPGQRGATAGDHPPLPALTEVTPGSIVTIGTTTGLHPAVETFHRTVGIQVAAIVSTRIGIATPRIARIIEGGTCRI